MRVALAALVFSVPVMVCAEPNKEVIETCMNGASNSTRITYASLPSDAFEIASDEKARRTETTLDQGNVGIWQTERPSTFGLIYKGKDISLRQVRSLSREKPVQFDPLLADWGTIRLGSASWICITFNFDGLGQSGRFQSVHGMYLIERTAHPVQAFYTVGRVTAGRVVLSK